MAAASGYPDGGTIDETYRERFQSFIGDDLDTPKALALIWDLIKDDKVSPADKRATILDFDRVLGLDIGAVPTRSIEEDAPAEVAALAEARQKAREEKDWKKADALRTEIESRGFEVLDTDKGASIKKKL
jgi:cysteinyl-tRNA synthetase